MAINLQNILTILNRAIDENEIVTNKELPDVVELMFAISSGQLTISGRPSENPNDWLFL